VSDPSHKCRGCGAPVTLNSLTCEYCGVAIKSSNQNVMGSYKENLNEQPASETPDSLGLLDKLRLNFLLGWNHYADFSGKATREQYWFYVLAIVFIYLIGVVLEAVFEDTPILNDMIAVLLVASYLALIIPTIAIGVRRLHDVDKSGWWYLISFIPLVGSLILLYWFVQPSKSGCTT
jgi:uncharacterized membrane protein YhaH (DUF805 family)